jgi:hypothetical protein
MNSCDVALLLILGTAEGGATRFEDICTTARYVAPQDWQPTSEVMRTAAERAIRDGLVVLLTDRGSGTEVLETTRLGQAAIITLMRKTIPQGGGGFARTCMTVRLCFLHLLPPPARDTESAALERLYRRAIDVVRRLQQLPPALAGPAYADLRSERVRLESELAWLEAMNTWQPVTQAAE